MRLTDCHAKQSTAQPQRNVVAYAVMESCVDSEGSITFGWLAPGVYFARFCGKLSADLATAYVPALQAAVETVSSLRYFADSSDLTSYDLLARSAYVRLLLGHRKKFAEIVILNWAGGLSATGLALSTAIGEPLVILDNRAEFERRLLVLSPGSRRFIAASRQTTSGPSEPQKPPGSRPRTPTRR